MTNDTLKTPGVAYKIPKISGNFSDDITIKNLRDTICHSFITTEEKTNDGTGCGEYLIFDDRAMCSRKERERLAANPKIPI